MSDKATETAYLIGSTMFVVPMVYFLLQAFAVPARSARLANFAVACGLGALVVPEVAPTFPDLNRDSLFADAVGRLAIGGLGFLVAVVGLVARRQGDGVVRPVAGILFTLLHLAVAAGMLVQPDWQARLKLGKRDPDGSWTYQSPKHGFTLKLPSADWKLAPRQDHVADFVRKDPEMQVMVRLVWPAATQDEFEEGARAARAFTRQSFQLVVEVDFAKGTNEAGNPYYFADIDEPGAVAVDSVGVGVVWCRKKRLGVMVLLYGHHRPGSPKAGSLQREEFHKAARQICLSVD